MSITCNSNPPVHFTSAHVSVSRNQVSQTDAAGISRLIPIEDKGLGIRREFNLQKESPFSSHNCITVNMLYVNVFDGL